MRVLDRIEEIIIATLIALATVIIFIAVVHRYAAGIPSLNPIAMSFEQRWESLLKFNFSHTQELCIFMFVWMAKFGAAYGVRTGIHVGVDVFVNMLGPSHRKRVILFGLLCGALFTFIVGTFGASFVHHTYDSGVRSNDLEVRMWLVYMAIPLGSYLMCFRFLQVAWHFARTGELPHHDASHVEGVEDVSSPAVHPAGVKP